jgi:hypothetical protein
VRLFFRSKNGGKDRLSRAQIEILRDFAKWVAAKFMSPKLTDHITINVTLDRRLFKESGHFGTAIPTDSPNNGRAFHLEIDVSGNFMTTLNNLAHEMVHVKQWALGEYSQYMRYENVYKFKGVEVDTNGMDYYDWPWEIEAIGRGVGLVHQFIEATGHEKKKWSKQLIVF